MRHDDTDAASDVGPLDAPLLGQDSPSDESAALVYRDERGRRTVHALANRACARIGRDATCDLVFQDPRVSRRHATIELVHGQHFLRDDGSSNGTFLNGLRVSSSNAFALRARDVIEIGAARIHYVTSSDEPTTPVSTTSSSEGIVHDLAELVKVGDAALDEAAKSALQSSIRGAFVGVKVARGIELVVPQVAARLGARLVAFFREDARHELRAVAGVPTFQSSSALVPVALRAWRDGRGHVVRGLAELDADQPHDTWVQAQITLAAVPVHDGERARGVLAVQRHGGARLSLRELAMLASIATRIAATMALKDGADAGDTRT